MKNDYAEFILNLHNRTGIDLSKYKESQMKRRLETIRNKNGYPTFSDYYSALTKDKILMNELLDKITINVTEFYRNYKRWDVLETKIIPELLKSGRKLKVWSAACSTGEEPYTVAMVLSKYLPLSQIHILATDLDNTVLSKAKDGVYSERSMPEVPLEMRKKYFVKVDDGYRISDDIKKAVSFRKHNLLLDVYPEDYDLIICRNVLIYFTEPAKDTVFSKFSKSLKKGGYLFVGSTEQIFNPQKFDFESADTFFYKKIQ